VARIVSSSQDSGSFPADDRSSRSKSTRSASRISEAWTTLATTRLECLPPRARGSPAPRERLAVDDENVHRRASRQAESSGILESVRGNG
jgi:hypothetical protein